LNNYCRRIFFIYFFKEKLYKKIPPENRRDHLYRRVSKYREINFPTQYYKYFSLTKKYFPGFLLTF
jgi:hypothetical protein